MVALAVTGTFISLGIPGSPPASLIFSSLDSISGKATEGAGALANGMTIGMRTRIVPTDALYILLAAAFANVTTESFVITENDGSTSSFTALVTSWDTTIAGQASFTLRLNSGVTRG